METFKPSDGISPLPSKGERLAEVLSRIAQDAPARSAEDAHIMLDIAFKDVELQYVAHPDTDFPMNVDQFENMIKASVNGKKLYYWPFAKDMLLLGDNGSIEIRSLRNDDLTEKKTAETHDYSDRPLVFEKVGADGRTLAEFLTS